MSNNPAINTGTNTETTRAENINTTINTGNEKNTGTGRFNNAKQSLVNAKDSFTRGAGKVGSEIKHYATDFSTYTQQNPGKALAIAIGSGIAIGYLIGAANRRNTYWSTVSGAVLGAIADRLR